MTRKVHTIGPDASVLAARDKMLQYEIRHLPVVSDQNKLVGIVTDRDIRSAMPPSLFEDLECTLEDKNTFCSLTVKDIMTPDPLSISPLYTIQDAMILIQKEHVGALPVVDEENTLTGIISIRDLLRAFINVMGIGEPGTLLGILAEEKVGELKKIVDIIVEEKMSLGSILVARHWEKNKRAIFPYVLAMNVEPIRVKLVKAGFTLIDPLAWYIDRLPEKDDANEFNRA
jgi:acetoin utilization protein AcuB